MKQATAEQPAPAAATPAVDQPAPPAPTWQGVLARQLDLQALIEKAITDNSGVEIVEKLLAMAKEVRQIQAREAWYRAMAEFQRQCPPIKKTKKADIASDRGRFSYRYAPLDEILETTRPVMGPLGLSVSWTTRFENKTVIANCRVSHEAGHFEESGEVPIPIDEASKMGATVAQRIGIATTYGKRYSLLSIIGIAPEDDDDAAHSDATRSTVQQPRRTSEAKGSSHPEGTVEVFGAITAVEPKQGSRPWKIKLSLPEGEETLVVTTFSDSLAGIAEKLKDGGELARVWYVRKDQFLNLVDITAAPLEG